MCGLACGGISVFLYVSTCVGCVCECVIAGVEVFESVCVGVCGLRGWVWVCGCIHMHP